MEEDHFFLDLPAFADALNAWLDTRTGWRTNVLRFTKNLLDDMHPRPISRDLDWGVPIPLEGWHGAAGQAPVRVVRRGDRLS